MDLTNRFPFELSTCFITLFTGGTTDGVELREVKLDRIEKTANPDGPDAPDGFLGQGEVDPDGIIHQAELYDLHWQVSEVVALHLW